MGKSLIHDPERAPLVRRAFDDYATGRYKRTTAEAGQDLGSHQSPRETAYATGDWRATAEPVVAGVVDVSEYGVRGKRSDFEPLISEELFYRVQAILSNARLTSRPTTVTPRNCARSARSFGLSGTPGSRRTRRGGHPSLRRTCSAACRRPVVQASLDQRQRFQQLFFPDGIAFDGNRFVRTGVTAPAFSYLRQIETGNEGLVSLNLVSWNQIATWLRGIDGLTRAS